MAQPAEFQVLSRDQVQFRRLFARTCEQVWPMFSRPKKLAAWFLPVTAFEARLGGRYTILSDNGGLDGTLTEFAPPNLIHFDGKMRFVLTPAGEDGCAVSFALARNDSGWIPSTLASFQTMLDNLERLVDGQPAFERPAYMKAWRLHYPVVEAELSSNLAGGAKIVHRLHFPAGEDKPSGDSAGQAETRSIIELLKSTPTLQLAIDGFADESLDRTKAFRLSQRRAEVVKRHLVESGISANRITTRAFGNYYRLHAGRDEESTRLNRRVELIPLY
jgi:outer membrane protein OmpA-like peptidoglycan-associated protein